jgi:hypothetical protein
MTEHETSPSPGIGSPAEATAPTHGRPTAQTNEDARLQNSAQATAEATAEKALARAERWWFAKKRFAFPSAVIIVFGIIMITTGGNDAGFFRSVTDAAQQATGSYPSIRPATAVMGKSVRDGKFAFTVTSLERPTKRFTDRFGTTQTAQGVFVIVRIDVTNIGYEPRTLAATDLYLLDDQLRDLVSGGRRDDLRGQDQPRPHGELRPGAV